MRDSKAMDSIPSLGQLDFAECGCIVERMVSNCLSCKKAQASESLEGPEIMLNLLGFIQRVINSCWKWGNRGLFC